MAQRWLGVLGVAVVGVMTVPVGAAMIYGLNAGGGIYTIDPSNGASSLLRATPASAGKTPNSLTYDSFNDRFYYITEADRKLYRVDSVGESFVGTLPSGRYFNAAFWGGSYWTVRENTKILMRVDLTGSSPVFTNFTLSGLPNLTFGDIAADETGVLYGSSRQGLFKVDLNALNLQTNTGSGTIISSSTPQLQIGFASGSLFGVGADSDTVFTINTSSGAVTQQSILQNRSLKIQDAAGVIPEPVAVVPLLAAAGIVGLRRRRV